MIRVNLLPVREAKKAANLRRQMVLLMVSTGLGVLISVGIQLNLTSEQSDQRRLISRSQLELAELDKTRKQVERFRKEREEIERKLGIIERLQASRQGPVRVMDEIASRIPKRLWLTELKMDQGTLQMKGMTLDAEIVAAFLTRLSDSPLFTEVELLGTRLEEKDGLKLNTFQIRSRYAFGGTRVADASIARGTPSRPRGR